MPEENRNTKEKLICVHCGDDCPDPVWSGENVFCCTGCQFVFEVLNDDDLKVASKEAAAAGVKPRALKEGEFEFLDNEKVLEELIDFREENTVKATLYTPQIYCSACLYILENLNRLDEGIIESRVNFLKKEITFTFDNSKTSFRKIVELLTTIGYRPDLNFSNKEKPKKAGIMKILWLKVGISGFIFGNVMLMAFPDYLAGGKVDPDLHKFLAYLSLVFALPLFYTASDYFKSAWTSLKIRYVNIDVPLSIGIVTLFLRSVWDVTSGAGFGFIDSMAGLIFFLLVGRAFQQKTYHSLSFSREFKSYFPLSVIRLKAGKTEHISIREIEKGDTIRIRNDEIIPADSKLLAESAMIDYSFVTGEAKPVEKHKGDKLFSGGKLIGKSVEIEVLKEFRQSYLTELWESYSFGKARESYVSGISNTAAKYFTLIVFLIAISTLGYWLPRDFGIALDAFTAVLIIACPCAIALSIPFTFGTAMRMLGKNGFFLKNDLVVEFLDKTDAFIFDKTGTLTKIGETGVEYIGKQLDNALKKAVKSGVMHSTHPLSRLIFDYLPGKGSECDSFNEIPGKGVEAIIGETHVKIGSYKWLKGPLTELAGELKGHEPDNPETRSYISINDKILGYFAFHSVYREGIFDFIKEISGKRRVIILSGDNASEKQFLESKLGPNVEMHFNMLPDGKYDFVKKLQEEGKIVGMAGDGLNDAGALTKADVGIAVTEDSAHFSPGADVIMLADKMPRLSKFFRLSNKALSTVYISYIISVVYHSVGFAFAVQGLLSPLIAAILMPLSSLTIVVFTTTKTLLDSKFLRI
jgi:Cu+-exporting ATPase